MSQRRARVRPAPATDALSLDGLVRFDDGDWVRFPVEPTHGQSKIVAKAVMAAAAADDRAGAILDCMAPTVAALALEGKLTDATTSLALGFPLQPEALDGLSAGKMNRLFDLALSIRDLIPNPPRPK